MKRTAALALCAALLWPSFASAGAFGDPSLGIAEAPLELPSLRPTGNGDLSQQALFDQKDQVPLFRGDVGGSMDKYMRPVYRTFESASDDVYDFLRRHVVQVLFPGDLSKSLSASPDTDSYAIYERELRLKEDRFAQQLLETYPGGVGANGFYTPQQMLDWQNWAAQRQVSILIDSFRDSLLERHGLDRFGRVTGDYAKNTDNWDPGFLAMSAIIGGSFLYLNGLHTTIPVGDLRVGLDLRSLMRVRTAMLTRSEANDVGGIELGWKNKPLVLTADWGTSGGHLVNDQVGLNYRLRY